MRTICQTLPYEVTSPESFAPAALEALTPSFASLTNRSIHSIRLEDGQVVRITVISGTAWVTQEGDPEDYILSPTSPLTLTGPGLLVVEAIHGDVKFSLGIMVGPSADTP